MLHPATPARILSEAGDVFRQRTLPGDEQAPAPLGQVGERFEQQICPVRVIQRAGVYKADFLVRCGPFQR